MYREEIQVLDCTVRDGGLINNYQFSESFVKACYRAACDAGIDFWEIGKKLAESDQYPRDQWGKWNFCDDDDIKMVIDSHESDYRPKIAVMYDVGRVDVSQLQPIDQSPIDMVRTGLLRRRHRQGDRSGPPHEGSRLRHDAQHHGPDRGHRARSGRGT